jgi:hypothetical protein
LEFPKIKTHLKYSEDLIKPCTCQLNTITEVTGMVEIFWARSQALFIYENLGLLEAQQKNSNELMRKTFIGWYFLLQALIAHIQKFLSPKV